MRVRRLFVADLPFQAGGIPTLGPGELLGTVDRNGITAANQITPELLAAHQLADHVQVGRLDLQHVDARQ
ncbi:MAG: hypothetical protein WCQ21_34125, partial [Verrucomicrobiota bacterium]